MQLHIIMALNNNYLCMGCDMYDCALCVDCTWFSGSLKPMLLSSYAGLSSTVIGVTQYIFLFIIFPLATSGENTLGQ